MKSKDFTLLYVEDDKNAQEWMKMALEDNFKEYYQAFDGEEGFAMYTKYKPDLIITDINMPISDGLDMAKKIKAIDKDQFIIIISAFDDKETLLKAINIGIDYFVPKPVDMDILNERISSVVNQLSNKKEIESFKQKEIQNLYYRAHYDTLTGIQNRFLFEKNLKQALSRAKRMDYVIIFFFIDLDNFKQINDTYGHAAGDIVLKGIVENMKKVIREEDIFARISGDEFALVMEATSTKNCNVNNVAEKLIEALGEDIQLNEHQSVNMSCSIGISCFPKDANTADALLRKADTAMYKAKKTGKAGYAYYSE